MSEVRVSPGRSNYQVSSSDKKGTIGTRADHRRHYPLGGYHDSICLETEAPLQFVDFTERLAEVVRDSGVRAGLVNIQTRHTTTAVMVNENEPLLLEDIREIPERLASRDRPYRHDDLSVRTINMSPNEPSNGYSHCKAMFLRTSETLNVAQGELQFGQWQRAFLIELDGPKKRTISVLVMGERV